MQQALVLIPISIQTQTYYCWLPYYMKYILIDPEGKFAKNMEWIVKSKDPRLTVRY